MVDMSRKLRDESRTSCSSLNLGFYLLKPSFLLFLDLARSSFEIVFSLDGELRRTGNGSYSQLDRYCEFEEVKEDLIACEKKSRKWKNNRLARRGLHTTMFDKVDSDDSMKLVSRRVCSQIWDWMDKEDELGEGATGLTSPDVSATGKGIQMDGGVGSVHQGGDKRFAWSARVQGGNKEASMGAQVCMSGRPFKDLKWSNVPGVKLSSLSESDDTFPSLQALSNLYYLFSGFMDYLWSWMKCADLVLSGRTSNALSIPRRLELQRNFVLAVGKLTLGLLPRYTPCFSGLIQCGRRCPILDCLNLGGVNVNSLSVNHVPEKLHDTDPEIIFGELGI
ncbi:hypothetical protein Tco_0032296 [Tanacetum coccineum]